ncbi:EF hand protein (macronuclear) [Tetrahymena thermophila SB210]|uniref:EF hand protein n=1 Tax=Tetrahymena thermophila (strain SB210) TaxID=312017 RepID=I7MKT3_TETTS|nr:EF hand protein [Tetrahymena thermophila SB210]EAS00267.1 EF hand protein [Tetrahymena thermophila SB210]|eukprot:XP_001020512.1 EF hand protein [Tetrahymena thermophila SB210]
MMKSSDDLHIKQNTFLDIRKQLYERDQQQMLQYQQSFRKSFEDEMNLIQQRHQVLLQQIYQNNNNNNITENNKNSKLLLKPKTSQASHRRVQISHLSDPSAINIHAIQYLNNSSLRNIKSSQDKRFSGTEKFFQQYITPTSAQLAKRQKQKSEQQFKILTPQYQTFVPGITQKIQSTQIKPLSVSSQSKLFSPVRDQTRPMSMQESKRRIINNLNFIENNLKDEKYAEFKEVETENLNKHIMFNIQSTDLPFNQRNIHTDKIYFNHHMSQHSQIPEYKKNLNGNQQQEQENIHLMKQTEENIKKIAQKVSNNIGDQFFLYSQAKQKQRQEIDNKQQKESQYEKTLKNMRKSKQTKSLDIPLRDLLISDPYKKEENDKQNFCLNLQQSTRNTWQRSKKQVEEMMKFNNQLIQEFKQKKLAKIATSIQNSNNSSSIFQTQIVEQTYKPQRQVLIVEIYNLQQIKRHLNLKYCYLYLPSINFNTLQTQEQRDFQEFKRIIMKKLKITAENIYLYQKNGTPIYSHRELKRNDITIFAGNCSTFAGLDKIYSTEENLQNLKKAIERLENKIIANQEIDDQLNKQSSLKMDFDQIQEVPSSNNNSASSTPLSKQTLARKNTMGSFTSKNQTPKSNLNKSQDNKTAKRSQFADFIKDDEDDQKKKMFFFEDDEENEENQPQKEIVDVNAYIKKVMKYLDLFFSKFDYNWRVDKEKEEIDLYLKYKLSQPKRIKKNKVIDFKLKGFEERKSNLEKLKKLNRDLFASNIGKILQEHELSESDLNSVYILYRSILNIQSQIISTENVIKEDDIMLQLDKFDHLTLENKALVESLCNYQDIIKWENFVKMLKNISNLDDQQKIDMFVQVFDSDNSGTLSIDEISHFSKLTMELLINEEKYPGFTQLLQDYFTKLLFTSLREEGKSEIPMEKIKKAIIEKNENCDILCFFCGTEAKQF